MTSYDPWDVVGISEFMPQKVIILVAQSKIMRALRLRYSSLYSSLLVPSTGLLLQLRRPPGATVDYVDPLDTTTQARAELDVEYTSSSTSNQYLHEYLTATSTVHPLPATTCSAARACVFHTVHGLNQR